MKKVLVVLVFLLTLTGCTRVKGYNEANVKDFVDLIMEYETGKKSGVIYIDLRPLGTEEGKEEGTYAKSHIQGFINYNVKNGSETEMVTWLKGMYDTKTAVILVDSDGTDVKNGCQVVDQCRLQKSLLLRKGFFFFGRKSNRFAPFRQRDRGLRLRTRGIKKEALVCSMD